MYGLQWYGTYSIQQMPTKAQQNISLSACWELENWRELKSSSYSKLDSKSILTPSKHVLRECSPRWRMPIAASRRFLMLVLAQKKNKSTVDLPFMVERKKSKHDGTPHLGPEWRESQEGNAKWTGPPFSTKSPRRFEHPPRILLHKQCT